MTEWKEYKLGELGTVITGKTPSKNNPEDWGNEMPFVTPSDYRNYGKFAKKADRNLSQFGINRLKGKVLPSKSILVTCIGSDMGKVVINTSQVITNQQINAIIPDSIVDSDFLYYRLVSMYETLRIYGGDGTAVPIVNKGDFENIETEIPSLPEQRAIASILSSLDDKIDLLRSQNATLEKMAETLFRQWFVEEAKEEWKDGNLGEVIEIYDNLRIPLSKMERDKKKDGQLYPYYGAAQIMDYINDYIFDGEYILLGEDGTVRTDEGYPVLQYATGKFWVNNHTHVLKAKSPYNNFFIWNYLKKKNIDEIVTGAVQPKINQANLKSIDFPKYPENMVNEFNIISEPFFMKINQNKIQIRTLTALRDTLLPKLMSGEVRVLSSETHGRASQSGRASQQSGQASQQSGQASQRE